MKTIYFTHKFTKGNLKGLHHVDKISYPTLEGCIEWIVAIERKHKQGKLDYRIIDKSFQNYKR